MAQKQREAPSPKIRAVPVRRSSTDAAMASLGGLSLHSRKVEAFLSGPAAMTEEGAFSLCERGHERPRTSIASAREADRNALGEYWGLIRAIPGSRHPPILSTDSDPGSALNAEGLEAAGWLDDDFLGEAIGRRFSSTPPMLTTVPREYFDALEEAEGAGADAAYLPGTNQILIASDIAGEADRRRVLLHEQLHYAAYLGGGDPSDMRWRDETGRPVFNGFRASAGWLHEGLAELLSQQLARDEGFETTFSSYPQELRVALFMQRLIGDEVVLRDAFLTGNFTEARARLDDALGRGTFDSLMGAATANGALRTLISGMDSMGIDYAPWLRDPIIAIARPRHTIKRD
jgi:hypothetical protein